MTKLKRIDVICEPFKKQLSVLFTNARLFAKCFLILIGPSYSELPIIIAHVHTTLNQTMYCNISHLSLSRTFGMVTGTDARTPGKEELELPDIKL